MKTWKHNNVEVSGFGPDTSYEQGCRAMVLAGMQWWEDHPNADPKFKGMKDVFGLVLEENDDAKDLTETIMNAECVHPEINDGNVFKVRTEATGAMHHAAIGHVLAYKRLGEDEYWKQLLERDEREAKEDASK